ncbi:MAG: hypothetical protein HY200_00305 [Nitrospirae bacterium]|nr:hypothetical protein [Nitrospirota bacterium]
MQCSRCQGQMIEEQFLDLRDDTGKMTFYGWHCLNCGDVTDPIIQAHRKQQTSPFPSRSRKYVVGVN